jgi:hypothetical protein
MVATLSIYDPYVRCYTTLRLEYIGTLHPYLLIERSRNRPSANSSHRQRMCSTWKTLPSKILSRHFPRPCTRSSNNKNDQFRLNFCRAFKRIYTVHFAILSTILAYHNYHTRPDSLVVAAMSTNSLCFKEALDARAKGMIELEEFLHHIVNHYRGEKHEADAEGQRPWLYAGFTDEVRTCVLSENYQPLDDDSKCFSAVQKPTLSCSTNMFS